MGTKLGMKGKIYYMVGGQSGGGAWTPLNNVRDVKTPLTKAEADVTTRENNGWEATTGTLRSGSVEFDMIYDPENAAYAAIQSAFLTDGAIIGLQVLDGEGGHGLQADFEIMDISRSEPLKEAMTVSVTAKITRSDTPPSFI